MFGFLVNKFSELVHTTISLDNRAMIWCAQARRVCPLKNQCNVWNRLTFVNKHFIFSRSLKEPSSGNCVKIFDCRVFGQFETLPSCWAFRHCVKANLYILLWYLNSVITKIAKYIVFRMLESLYSHSLCLLEISLYVQALSGT